MMKAAEVRGTLHKANFSADPRLNWNQSNTIWQGNAQRLLLDSSTNFDPSFDDTSRLQAKLSSQKAQTSSATALEFACYRLH